MNFGIKLKALRTEKKLTQSQLAEILQTSKSNISKYEANSIEPNFETLVKISKLFGVSIDYLLGLENIDSTTKRLLTYYAEISDLSETSENTQDLVNETMVKSLISSFNKLNETNKYIIMGKTMELLKEQIQEDVSSPSHTELEIEKAITIQKNKSAKIR